MQGALLSILLFSKKANHAANVVLGFGMLAFSIDIFHSIYIVFEYYKEFPEFIGATFAFPHLYGPIFYIYARLISSGEKHFDKKYFLHFIPFLLVNIYGFMFAFLESNEFKIQLVKGDIASMLPAFEFFNYFKPIHGIIYVYFTIDIVSKYHKKIKNNYSNIEKINLDWLRYLNIGLIVSWGIVALSYLANAVLDNTDNFDQLIYLSASILIYSIGYMSLRQPQILAQNIDEEVKEDEVKDSKLDERKSYQKSGLTDKVADELLQKLISLMEDEKPYLDCELTLQDLAEKLSISTHNLSEVINTKLNKNFYDFINSYRVEEVKLRLADEDSKNYSIIAIAFDSGFNSKSSFNTTFKKYNNMTPSQYRKLIQSGEKDS